MTGTLVTYLSKSEPEGGWRSGVVIDGRVVELASVGGPPTVKEALQQGGAATRRLIEYAARSSETVDLNDVRLGPPIPNPDKIICIGLNYRAHAKEAGFQVPSHPIIFSKYVNGLVGDASVVNLPEVSDRVDYEGELAVVIGATCHAVSVSEAQRYVAGYSVFNDLSARDLQMRTSQFTAGKILDGFAPMGPWLVPAWEIPDPQNLKLETRVNGATVQSESTADMIFSVSELISDISTILTLAPGDVIATGTPSGVGMAAMPPRFLDHGDEVEVEVGGIGVLRTYFRRGDARIGGSGPWW